VPGLALALWAAFGAVAVLGRELLQRRMTGSSGLIGIGPSPSAADLVSGAALLAAVLAGVGGPLLELAGAIEPVAALDTGAVRAIGLALFAVGICGVVASQLAMGAAWRVGVDPAERTELVTEGPFAVVRNPIYTAIVPSLAGIALVAPSVPALLCPPLGGLAFALQTRLVEEPHLLAAHGEAYAGYARRVGRFLPGLGRID
jgi:protein-S-isoprenylcysteine O-methyltransferase Ste14